MHEIQQALAEIEQLATQLQSAVERTPWFLGNAVMLKDEEFFRRTGRIIAIAVKLRTSSDALNAVPAPPEPTQTETPSADPMDCQRPLVVDGTVPDRTSTAADRLELLVARLDRLLAVLETPPRQPLVGRCTCQLNLNAGR